MNKYKYASVNNFRYVSERGCKRCKIPVSIPNCCPNCGGTFIDGIIELELVFKEVWIPVKFKWYKPSTWSGGYWKRED